LSNCLTDCPDVFSSSASASLPRPSSCLEWWLCWHWQARQHHTLAPYWPTQSFLWASANLRSVLCSGVYKYSSLSAHDTAVLHQCTTWHASSGFLRDGWLAGVL
jgi:hypothetical protein